MKHKEKSDKEQYPIPYRSIALIAGISLIFIGVIIIFNFSQINPEPSATHINHTSIPAGSTLIDTRPKSDFENRTIGGSISIPCTCDSCFRSKIKLYDRSSIYVVFGPNATNASDIMLSEGFTNIFILDDYTFWTGP